MSEIATISQDIEYELLAKSTNASISKHLLDDHFTLVAANERYYEMFGYSKEEYETLFHNHPDEFYANDLEDWKELCDTVIQTINDQKTHYEIITRMRHKDGRKLWIKLNGNFTDEYVNGYRISYSVMTDMTALMSAQIEKEATQNNFPGLIAKYKVRVDGFECLYGNHNYYKVFRNKTLLKLDEITESSGLLQAALLHKELRLGKTISFAISPVTIDGTKHFYNVNAQCIDWINEEPIYLLIYNDITTLIQQKKELEEYNHSLHKLAYSDELTKGFNRRKFDAVAAKAIKEHPAGTYQMVWFNIQKFKVLNDIGGVEAGDRALCYVYKKILEHLRFKEYAARLFSDNFILLLFNDSQQETIERLNELAVAINQYNVGSEYKYYLTFTAGIYHILDSSLPLIYMEDRAHAARQNDTKEGGDLCVCNFYDEDILQQMLNEKTIENRMRQALKNREFEVYLQPKYSLKTNHIAGAEALIRWNDPKKGLIPPNDFIPLFEANGFIVELDLFVFEEVCKLIRKWIDEGHALLPISVNMSRVHFANPNFLKSYITLRNQYDIPQGLIEIELTETMIFENPEVFSNFIKELHQAGFPCSMDDFGSGYSTLNLLKNLDFDVLKLDGAFFSNEEMNNARENVIVHSVVDMAKALEITTVAEGIETEEQLEFLRTISCDLIQGYVFSKPLPVSQFEKLYEAETNHSDCSSMM